MNDSEDHHTLLVEPDDPSDIGSLVPSPELTITYGFMSPSLRSMPSANLLMEQGRGRNKQC